MQRRRAGWLVLLLSVPACQCLEPVAEPAEDAGRGDAGADAGVSNDGGQECFTASDCRGTPWAPCIFGLTAGLSCVEQRCVSECRDRDAGRTCDYAPSNDCMTCGGEPPLCNADTCATDAFSATVSLVGCRPGVTPPLVSGTSLSFVPVRGASCELSVSTSVGGLGQVVRSQADTRHFWFIRQLGGWCVGEQLPTGAIRSTVACPDCTFGLEGF